MRRTLWLLAGLLGCNPSGTPAPHDVPVATGAPAAELDPPALVEIEPIAAHTVARREVRVRSVGEGPLTLEELSIAAPRPAAWSVVSSVPTGTPIPPGEQSVLRIDYRPCAAELAAADTCACPRRTDSAILRVKTDANDAAHLLTLAASAIPSAPRIEVDPPFELRLDEAGTDTGTVSIRNVGCRPLTLSSAVLTGPGGSPSGAVDDFSFETCDSPYCRLETTICEQGCDVARVDLHIRYANDDPVHEDIAELHIFTDDPVSPDRTLVLEGSGPQGCLPPTARVRTSTRACVGAPVHLDASESEPSSSDARITGYSWAMVFWQLPKPEIEVSDEQSSAWFVPPRAGVYVVSLSAHTSCGPPGSTLAQVQVASTGCE